MIFIYDKNGKILAEYEDHKRSDVLLDLHNGSLPGRMIQCADLRMMKWADGEFVEKSIDEKHADKLITKKERDEAVAAIAKMNEEVLIRDKIRAFAIEELKKEGKL